MTKQRTQVHFDRPSYEVDYEKLHNEIKKIEKVMDYLELISGKRELITIGEVASIIEKKTGFKNIELASDLIGMKNEYLYLINNLSSIDWEFIKMDKGIPKFKPEVLVFLKDKHTTYLREDLEEEYNVLTKIVEAANMLSNPNNARYLKVDYKGKYSINLQPFNSQV